MWLCYPCYDPLVSLRQLSFATRVASIIICSSQAVRSVDLFIMPVKNKNGFGENTPSKSKKLVDEDEKDADGKHDDCSDLTDNNNDTEESTSRSFPQKVSSFSCFRCMRRSEYVKRQGFNVSSRALSIRPSSDCDCDK